MAFRVFLDANVLLDFTLKREGYENSKLLMERIIDGQIEGFISSSIVHIVGYWLAKSYGPLTAKKILLSLLASIQVVDIEHETTIHALHSKIDDIEDALQYYAAIHWKMDAFISEDKQLQKEAIAVLPVYTTAGFLKNLEEVE